jgi:tetratricopeptide (TPR) repeat protein
MELDTQLARAQGLQGRFGHALLTLETVQSRLLEGETRARIRYELEMGRILLASGYATGAWPNFKRAATLAETAGEDALMIEARRMVALIEPDRSRRIAADLEILKRAEVSSDRAARAWRGVLWADIGAAFQSLGRLDKALEAFEMALACWEEDDPTRSPVARWMIGWTFRLQGRLSEALAAQEALALEHARGGTKDAHVQEEIGEIHLALATGADAAVHRRRAQGHFARAYATLKMSGDPPADPEHFDRIKRLAEGRE